MSDAALLAVLLSIFAFVTIFFGSLIYFLLRAEKRANGVERNSEFADFDVPSSWKDGKPQHG